MRFAHGLLFVLALASVAAAQDVAPALMVKTGDASQPLEITKVAIDARIFGYLAETRMTLTFHNRHDRVLAGDLIFPLPEGATVSGYALDVNGVMVDGVVVEKHKARQVFEKEARKGVDPGLVEHVKGNSFKTRVFPIPAGGSRTVMVKYVSDLPAGPGGARWRLPMNFKRKVKQLSLRVEVVKPGAPPVIDANGPANFRFEKWRDSFVAETTLVNAGLDEDLIVALPEAARQKVLVEKASDGQYYFVIHDHPSAPVDLQALAAPATVTVLWDASGSRGGIDHAREFELLRAYFGQFKASRVYADLVVFRNVTSRPERFVIDGGDVSALIAKLKQLPYDGGTQAPRLDWAGWFPRRDMKAADATLAFTDGIFNFGKEDVAGEGGLTYVFSMGPVINAPVLRRMGVQYFNLNLIDVRAAVSAIGRPAFSFLRADAGGAKLAQTYPRIPQPVRGRFTLAGKLTGPEATVELSYGFAGKATVRSKHVVSRKDAAEGDLLRRAFAQRQLEELMIQPKRNDERIVTLGKTYGLVTPGTSLMVLETLEQYVEYEIAPPRSLPKVRADYLAAMDAKAAEEKKAAQAKIDTVLTMWKGRVEWWNKEFKVPKDFKHKPPTTRPTTQPTGVAGLLRKTAEDLAEAQRIVARSEAGQRAAEAALQAARNKVAKASSAVDKRQAAAEMAQAEEALRKAQANLRGAERYLAAIQEYSRRLTELLRWRARVMGANHPRDLDGLEEDLRRLAEVAGRAAATQPSTGTNDLRDLTVRVPNFQGPRADLRTSNAAVDETENSAGGALFDVEESVAADRRLASVTAGFVGSGGLFGKSAGPVVRPGQPAIVIREWDPKTPYLKDLKAAKAEDALAVYMKHRKTYGNSPAFFLDCANFFFTGKRPALGLQVLSNIAELELASPALLRVLAHRLAQLGELDLAVGLFEQVLQMRPEEPQSYRDLALVLARRADTAKAPADQARADYARAMGLLNDVVMKQWDRFEEIELVALMELNALIPRAKAAGAEDVPLDKRLVKLLDCDVRIVLNWDADMTDIDLHVIEPSGEEAYYEHDRTTIGGLVSEDFTDGYGPEEYLLRKAMHGAYKIRAEFYGSSATKLLGAVTIQVDVFTNFGRPGQTRKSITLRLMEEKENIVVGEIEF